jgi:hypothetical protein
MNIVSQFFKDKTPSPVKAVRSAQCLAALFAAVCLAPSLGTAQSASGMGDPSGADGGIQAVYFDVSQLHHDPASNRDTWDYAWAANNALYSFNCDGRGYGKGAATSASTSWWAIAGTAWSGAPSIPWIMAGVASGGSMAPIGRRPVPLRLTASRTRSSPTTGTATRMHTVALSPSTTPGRRS